MGSATQPVGGLLREWRQRRRMSQLDLALGAEVSARHVSFIETGRSVPSRQMVLHLAQRLEIPLRERNAFLLAAGYAPAFRERPLSDPALDAARQAVDLVLAGHEPYPAIAVDRHWSLLASNQAAARLLAGVAPALLQPPANVLRLSLHPEGVAPRIANLAEWRAHLLARLGHQVDVTADPVLVDLMNELREYPVPGGSGPDPRTTELDYSSVVVPLRLVTPAGILSFISTTTVFGTPVEITLSELALETFFPADAPTAAFSAQRRGRSAASGRAPMTSPNQAAVLLFRRMHQEGLLILPNAWDAGTARLIESLGAKAIATTSCGVAWSHGYADGDHLPVPLLLATIAGIARSVKVPLTADVEGGYSSDPAAVGETVAEGDRRRRGRDQHRGRGGHRSICSAPRSRRSGAPPSAPAWSSS